MASSKKKPSDFFETLAKIHAFEIEGKHVRKVFNGNSYGLDQKKLTRKELRAQRATLTAAMAPRKNHTEQRTLYIAATQVLRNTTANYQTQDRVLGRALIATRDALMAAVSIESLNTSGPIRGVTFNQAEILKNYRKGNATTRLLTVNDIHQLALLLEGLAPTPKQLSKALHDPLILAVLHNSGIFDLAVCGANKYVNDSLLETRDTDQENHFSRTNLKLQAGYEKTDLEDSSKRCTKIYTKRFIYNWLKPGGDKNTWIPMSMNDSLKRAAAVVRTAMDNDPALADHLLHSCSQYETMTLDTTGKELQPRSLFEFLNTNYEEDGCDGKGLYNKASSDGFKAAATRYMAEYQPANNHPLTKWLHGSKLGRFILKLFGSKYNPPLLEKIAHAKDPNSKPAVVKVGSLTPPPPTTRAAGSTSHVHRRLTLVSGSETEQSSQASPTATGILQPPGSATTTPNKTSNVLLASDSPIQGGARNADSRTIVPLEAQPSSNQDPTQSTTATSTSSFTSSTS